MKIGHITLVDPTMAPDRQEKMVSEIERVIASIFQESSQFVTVPVAKDREQLRTALLRLCDKEKCPLVLTTGGTGPAAADIVPDITLEVVDRKLPGFGEIMRYYSYERFKVSLLSRAEAGVRGRSLIINLPARPQPVKFCLRLMQEGIIEALEQIAEIRLTLRGDEIVVPIDKYLPFLKKIRPKPNPDGDKHPYIQ